MGVGCRGEDGGGGQHTASNVTIGEELTALLTQSLSSFRPNQHAYRDGTTAACRRCLSRLFFFFYFFLLLHCF